jgi:hypothetical protein
MADEKYRGKVPLWAWVIAGLVIFSTFYTQVFN